MSRKFWAVLSVLLVAILAITACAPVPAAPAPAPEPAKATEVPAPAAAEPVTLTWAFWGSPEEAVSHKAGGRCLHEGAPGDQDRDLERAVGRLLHQDPGAVGQRRSKGGPGHRLPVAHAQVRGRGCAGEPGPLHPEVRLQPERLLGRPAGVCEVQRQRLRPAARQRGQRPVLQQGSLRQSWGQVSRRELELGRPSGRGPKANGQGCWRQGDAVRAGGRGRQVVQVAEPERRCGAGRLS